LGGTEKKFVLKKHRKNLQQFPKRNKRGIVYFALFVNAGFNLSSQRKQSNGLEYQVKFMCSVIIVER
jgi:hypothetical protein